MKHLMVIPKENCFQKWEDAKKKCVLSERKVIWRGTEMPLPWVIYFFVNIKWMYHLRMDGNSVLYNNDSVFLYVWVCVCVERERERWGEREREREVTQNQPTHSCFNWFPTRNLFEIQPGLKMILNIYCFSFNSSKISPIIRVFCRGNSFCYPNLCLIK